MEFAQKHPTIKRLRLLTIRLFRKVSIATHQKKLNKISLSNGLSVLTGPPRHLRRLFSFKRGPFIGGTDYPMRIGRNQSRNSTFPLSQGSLWIVLTVELTSNIRKILSFCQCPFANLLHLFFRIHL